MTQDVIPTTEPIYWVARDDDGTVIHSGVTEVGQVTTTGQKNLIKGSKNKQVLELEKYLGKRPSRDHEPDIPARSWKNYSLEKS